MACLRYHNSRDWCLLPTSRCIDGHFKFICGLRLFMKVCDYFNETDFQTEVKTALDNAFCAVIFTDYNKRHCPRIREVEILFYGPLLPRRQRQMKYQLIDDIRHMNHILKFICGFCHRNVTNCNSF